MPPGKTYKLLTDYFITAKPVPPRKKWLKSNHSYIRKAFLVYLDGYFFHANFGCHHDILMLSRSTIKWRQCPDVTIALDWDAKPQLKNKQAKFHLLYTYTFHCLYMSRDARKPVFGVSEQVPHKPACTSSERARSLKFRI